MGYALYSIYPYPWEEDLIITIIIMMIIKQVVDTGVLLFPLVPPAVVAVQLLSDLEKQ